MFMMESEEGNPQPFTVVKIEGDEVVVDFNHPLAGQELVFNLYIRDVREATLEELLKNNSSCGPNCDKGCC
jgi:FKBP-type peptidyl-prolyl cis-trans isomerase SlyD